jgi:aminopeptidase N
MARIDPHSYFDDAQPRVESWHLRLRVDFARKALDGEVTLLFPEAVSGTLDLDTRGLTIHRCFVTATNGDLPWELGPEDPILGSRLRLRLPKGCTGVCVAYETHPEASGLQWLEPAQTADGTHPFLYSQCQAIHARSVVPCQDCAVARIRYTAEVTVPEGLRAVLSAGAVADLPGLEPGTRIFHVDMPQPIPPYLFALAVGRLEARELGPRSRVYAEPGLIEKAAWEFAEVEGMLRRAEALFGPYPWERYDLLVLPPSFPYGGMENPRLTFLTPTLLAGDRSLVDVVAHELAHSWTGNLVTNATMEHFWLNEGFTVWAERKLLAALSGEDAATLAWALGQKELEEAFARFRDRPALTRLRTRLEGVDPDEAYSPIPYEKGARFVALLERTAGPAAFDRALQAYLARFRFRSITTEQWRAFMEEALPGLLEKVDADAWLEGEGLPSNAPVFASERLERLVGLAQAWGRGPRPEASELQSWNPAELRVFLQHLPEELPAGELAWLDATLDLTARGNAEVLVAWLRVAAGSDYAPVFPRVREHLGRVGRMKYLRPLYGALGRHPRTAALAREIYAQASAGYHQLGRRVAEEMLARTRF